VVVNAQSFKVISSYLNILCTQYESAEGHSVSALFYRFLGGKSIVDFSTIRPEKLILHRGILWLLIKSEKSSKKTVFKFQDILIFWLDTYLAIKVD
jgi:hypothetical protein